MLKDQQTVMEKKVLTGGFHLQKHVSYVPIHCTLDPKLLWTTFYTIKQLPTTALPTPSAQALLLFPS